LILKLDHKKILQEAINQAKNPDDIPKVETLHQNLAHMIVALKEVETRLIRVANKTSRHKIENSDPYCIPLAKCVETIKKQIKQTKEYLKKYDLFDWKCCK